MKSPNLAMSRQESVVELSEHHQTVKAVDWKAKISYAAFFFGTVAMMCTAVMAIYQHAAMRKQQETVSVITTELEQLRTDVVTTSSENSIYLKIMLLRPGIDKMLARDIAHSVAIRAREHHRDPDLVLSIIAVESSFNPNEVSSTGALGLMQVMPMWKSALGLDRDLRDIDTNVKAGLDILAGYEQTFGGLEMALTAYNKGPNQIVSDIKAGRVPFNGYSVNVMRTYGRIKAWYRP